MQQPTLANYLWGKQASVLRLMFASLLLILFCLGARDLWTQEHRWADIVFGMFYRHDFLHPYLGETMYYDKPLLSYWLMVAIANVSGLLNTWVLRMPSAVAGLIAIWSIYCLGVRIKDKQLGLLAGWMLLTTFYFLFWARTSSADMLNMAGSLAAISWFVIKRDKPTFFNMAVFFMVVALTALCKGLGGVVVPFLAVLVDVTLRQTWKTYLRPALFLAILPALVIYMLPFWASSHFGGADYHQSGLYLVYKENILRYVHPFDHRGPVYTYFMYLPIYLLPWAVFFIPALAMLMTRWKTMTLNSKWVCWTLLVLFMFFTLSGSRRSYYVLPLVPFAILLTADWILSDQRQSLRKQVWASACVLISFVLLLVTVDFLPAWYYSKAGVSQFAVQLMETAEKQKPWHQWNVVMLDAESKLDFYLQLPPSTQHFGVMGARKEVNADNMKRFWPILFNPMPNTIYVSRRQYASLLKKQLPSYQVVELKNIPKLPFLVSREDNAPIAFIPPSQYQHV